MLHRSLAESAGYLWQPEEFEILANLDFNNIKHLQNPGYLLLTATSTRYSQRKNEPSFPGFAGNSHKQKPNIAQKKLANNNGDVQHILLFPRVSTGINFLSYPLSPNG